MTNSLYSRYGVFHQSLEQYLNRHWRAYTVPRMGLFWLASYGFMQHALVSFAKTFPNIHSYKKFSAHPNYNLMGPVYSYFYLLRPAFWTYVFYRMTKIMYVMIKNHYLGKDDLHYTWYYDTLYPDLLHDEEDMRYINFRYSDAKVVPDPITGYYPYDNLKYGKFLNKKDSAYSEGTNSVVHSNFMK